MNISVKLTSLLGVSCLLAFANVAPAQADSKPCCWNDGRYFSSSVSTCTRYGGRVVDRQYCGGDSYYDRGYGYDQYDGYDRRRSGVSFSITLGDVAFGYSDGYYDRHRRWHSWRSDRERDWYRRNHSDSFYGRRHDRDDDHDRRDWRDGRRNDWR